MCVTSLDVCYELLLAYNNAVVLGMYLAESRDDLIKMSNLAKELIRVSRKSDNSEIYAIACFHAGVIGNALQDYKNAIKHLEEALTVFEIIGHDEGLMLACKNLAEAYRGIGQKSKAEMYQNRAEAIAKSLKTNTTLSETTFWLKKWKNLPWVVKR